MQSGRESAESKARSLKLRLLCLCVGIQKKQVAFPQGDWVPGIKFFMKRPLAEHSWGSLPCMTVTGQIHARTWCTLQKPEPSTLSEQGAQCCMDSNVSVLAEAQTCML